MEEAGLEQKHLKIEWDFKKELRYNVNGRPKVVYYWLAELVDPLCPITLSDEHTHFKWLKFEDALTYSAYPDMQQTLSDINTYLEGTK